MDEKTKTQARFERKQREHDRAARARKRIDADALIDLLQDVALGRREVEKEQLDALKYMVNKVLPNMLEPAQKVPDPAESHAGKVFLISWGGEQIPQLKRVEGVVMDDTGVLQLENPNAKSTN